LAEDLKKGKVQAVIHRLERLQPRSDEARKCWAELIDYYRDHACRMRYDEYLRLGYGIGSGAVESAHKQGVHARMRQAGMRWSEAGARRLLALRLLLLKSAGRCWINSACCPCRPLLGLPHSVLDGRASGAAS
jgi:hypothetical protein